MVATIRAVKHKRRKFVVQPGRMPYLHELAVRDGQEAAVRRKAKMVDALLEIKVVQNDSAKDIDKKCASICRE